MHPFLTAWGAWLHLLSMETLHSSVFYFNLLFDIVRSYVHTQRLKFFAAVFKKSEMAPESTPTKRRGEELSNVSISAGYPSGSRQMIFRSVWAPIKCPVQSRVLCLSGQPLLLPFAKWAPLNVQLDSTIPHRKPLEQRQHGREEGHDGFILFLPATHSHSSHINHWPRRLDV